MAVCSESVNMDQPLLFHTSSTSSLWSSSSLGSFALFSLILLFLIQIQPSNSTVNLTEIEVGDRPEWKYLLQPYLGMYSLITKSSGEPMKKVGQNPVVDISNCQQESVSCVEVCRRIRIMQRAKQKGENAKLEVQYCERDFGKACWEVAKMQCWHNKGGMEVSDGFDTTWKIRRRFEHLSEDQEGNEGGKTWLHGSGTTSNGLEIAFFFFMWGKERTYESICKTFMKGSSTVPNTLLRYISKATDKDPTKPILLAGHSEGSGWAICTYNFIKHGLRLPNPVYVIVSGALVPTQSFSKLWLENQGNPDDLLSLVVGGKKADIPNLESDIYLSWLRGPPHRVTWPSFGYSCTHVSIQSFNFGPGGFQCLPPGENGENVPDIQSTYSRTTDWSDPTATSNLNAFLYQLHLWNIYRNCMLMCWNQFDTWMNEDESNKENFETNVPPMKLYPMKGALVNAAGTIKFSQSYAKVGGIRIETP